MKNYLHKMDFGKTMDNVGKMEKTMTKYEKKGNKIKKDIQRKVSSFKAMLMAVCIGLSFAVVTLLYSFYIISNWYAVHRVSFRQPVLVQNPVVIKKIEEPKKQEIKVVKVLVVENKMAIINELYRKIRWNESNAGMNKKEMLDLHNYCQSIGMINEIGWIPKKGSKYCFSDYGEQWKQFVKEFEGRLTRMTRNEALCEYNTGTKQPMCTYSIEIDGIK